MQEAFQIVESVVYSTRFTGVSLTYKSAEKKPWVSYT